MSIVSGCNPYLKPFDLLLAIVGLLDRSIKYANRGAPDVRTGAIALDERNDRVIGHGQLAVPNRYRRTKARKHRRLHSTRDYRPRHKQRSKHC
jgi:hypothetical protein